MFRFDLFFNYYWQGIGVLLLAVLISFVMMVVYRTSENRKVGKQIMNKSSNGRKLILNSPKYIKLGSRYYRMKRLG